ncbi:MAG: hypothetical protein H0T93_11805 [Chloroflexia bacterium]|nr:hypothetical protein [Chloroflexia bacterium]
MIGRAASGRGATGRAGNWKPKPKSVRAAADKSWNRLGQRVPDALEPVLSRVSRQIRESRWVLERVAVIYPIQWSKWQTANDERTCPECAPMHGRSWPDDRPMPEPPLHVNCRCQAVYARTEWRVRYVPAWRLRWFTRQAWEWTRTGWK